MKRADSYGPAGKNRPGSRAGALDAETLAAQALSFLADDPERLDRFLAVTGLGAATLRAAAEEPGFALGILGYLADHESLLVAFAERQRLAPERLGRWIAERVGGSGWVDP